MRKQQLLRILLIVTLLIGISLSTGCSDSTSGGTIETTNGYVANVDGSPAQNAQVILIPEGYNPNGGDPKDLLYDTTNEFGAYQLSIPVSGSYNIQVLNLENGTRALLQEAVLSEKTDTVPLIQLTHPGVFIINVPDSLSEEPVYYFSGTTFKWQRSQIDTAFDGSLVFADLPGGSLPSLEADINTTLLDKVPVKSQDSVYHDIALTWRSFTTENSSIASDNITSIFTDKNGFHWIATYGGGVSVHNSSIKGFFDKDEHALKSNNVNDLTIDKEDVIYIATDAGFVIYNDSTLQAHEYEKSPNELSSNDVYSIALDSSKGCWLGTGAGVDYHDYKENQWINSLSDVIVADITVDRNNNVWVATTLKGVYFFDGNGWTQYTTANGLNDDRTNAVIERSNGDIVVGHREGKLSIFSNDTWTKVTNEQSSAEGEPILCFYETDKGTLFAGTGGGLIRNEDGYWKRTTGTIYDEIEEFSIRSISDDANGNMWVGTGANGVYVFGPDAEDIIFKRALLLRAF